VPTIVDHQIRQLSRDMGLIEPFDAEQLNPASYDVRIGETIFTEGTSPASPRWMPWNLLEKPYVLRPGEFILAHTVEIVRVPNNMEAVFQLKSSRGREGYEHALAGYIDAGFTGQVTLEISNINRFHTLPINFGMRIGQLRFMKLDDIPHRPYSLTGRYNNDMGVVASKG
jgi:dCTP deaminase